MGVAKPPLKDLRVVSTTLIWSLGDGQTTPMGRGGGQGLWPPPFRSNGGGSTTLLAKWVWPNHPQWVIGVA
jgi:hypothetical protein